MKNILTESSYGLTLANESYEWYRCAAIRSRRFYRISETAILVVSALISTSASIVQNDSRIPAVLGAVIVILSGLRALFHWHDNYLRFSGAREAIEAQRRLYHTGADPYDNPDIRDQVLVAEVSRIEQEEMAGWIKIAAERPKP